VFVFYLLAQLEILAGTRQAEGLYALVKTFLGVDLSSASRLAEYREVLWRSAFLFLFSKAELFWVFILGAFVGPGLIADDLKARALPIYFARPVNPRTYLLGKWTVIAFFKWLGPSWCRTCSPAFRNVGDRRAGDGRADRPPRRRPVAVRPGRDGLRRRCSAGPVQHDFRQALCDGGLGRPYACSPSWPRGSCPKSLPPDATRGMARMMSSLYGDVAGLTEWWLGISRPGRPWPLPQEHSAAPSDRRWIRSIPHRVAGRHHRSHVVLLPAGRAILEVGGKHLSR